MIAAFDTLMIFFVIWLAWNSLASKDLFKGIVLFIAFGLLMALAWVRLNAPDIALAEAAIGSGVTGALLLSTLGRLRRMESACPKNEQAFSEDAPRPRLRPMKWLLYAGILAVAFLLFQAVSLLPSGEHGLAVAVQERIHESGASNPVTAVLLNFRAYDTLLEIAVLLIAVAGAWSLAAADAQTGRAPVSALQTALAHLLAPVMLVAAVYLMWKGSSAPGGAFQAGAVLGGAGILLILSKPEMISVGEHRSLRGLLTAGLIVFIAAGFLVMLPGRRLLEYPEGWAGAIILIIEAAAAVSIGATLALLFAGGRLENPAEDD